MAHFDDRAWLFLAKCEKLACFWPYHKKTTRLAVKIGFPVLFLSSSTTVMIRCIKEWNVNLHIALEDALLGLLHFAIFTKFLRREIYDKVALQFETIVEESEAAVLRRYSNAALTFTIKYIVFVGIAFGCYDIYPTARMFFDYFFAGGTLEKKLPFYVDYLVDEQEYFYCILAHLSVVVLIGVVIEFTYELNFFLTVRHACALFEIVKLRLKRASDIFQQCDPNNTISETDEQRAYEIISSAVDLHNEALTLVQSIEGVFSNCSFIVLFTNMVGLAPMPVLVIIYLHAPFELLRRGLILATILVHFYVVFLQGQMTSDHSSSIFEACYDFHWYKSSKRSRVVMSVIMMQSLTPSQLTGGNVFILSMETYANMLKTALSYISMFAALDINIDVNK